jgi:hypothetical protein
VNVRALDEALVLAAERGLELATDPRELRE